MKWIETFASGKNSALFYASSWVSSCYVDPTRPWRRRSEDPNISYSVLTLLTCLFQFPKRPSWAACNRYLGRTVNPKSKASFLLILSFLLCTCEVILGHTLLGLADGWHAALICPILYNFLLPSEVVVLWKEGAKCWMTLPCLPSLAPSPWKEIIT